MAITITATVGNKSKDGKPATNTPADIAAVQDLLTKALGTTNAPRMTRGECDRLMVGAIEEFQRLWTDDPKDVDGRVDPGGKTLIRLNRVVTPLQLNPIKLASLYWRHQYPTQRGFGYEISYDVGYKDPRGIWQREVLPNQPRDGAVATATRPSPYRLYLQIGGSEVNSMEITDRQMIGVIKDDNLPKLLKLLEKVGRWASSVECRLVLKYGSGPVSKSSAVLLPTPVKPYSGSLGLDLLAEKQVEDMTYAATKPKGTDGRYLWTTPFNKKYYFSYGARFETKKELRGLVCITYIGAVYGVSAKDQVADKKLGGDDGMVDVMSAYGTQLANYLDAQKTAPAMEGKKGDEVKGFFKKNNRGTFIMWKAGHSVLVKDGVVHEFTDRNGKKRGYWSKDAQEYGYGNSAWWVRKVRDPPAVKGSGSVGM